MATKIFRQFGEYFIRSHQYVKRSFQSLPYIGWGRYCPVCGKKSNRFVQYGVIPREDARCMHCGALERHRLVWLFFERMTDLFDGKPKKMLHIAPERAFEALLKKQLGAGYLTADLINPRAMVRMDITNIQFPSDTFDVIYCSHVLEHVPDDKLAIHELYRILKPDGWAVILVPINADKTFEDPSVVDPTKRLELFGQKDHLRRYGPDFRERLIEEGFNVKVFVPSDFLQDNEVSFMAIRNENIYYCKK